MRKSKINYALMIAPILELIIWIVYFYKFYEVYSLAYFFVPSETSFLVKVVYLFTQDEKLYSYLFVGFILLIVNMLTIMALYFLKKSYSNIYIWFSTIQLLLSMTCFMVTVIWPIMLPLSVVVLVFGYVIHTINDTKYGDDKRVYEEHEIIKEAGPFCSMEESLNFFEEFSKEWQDSFDKNQLKFFPKVTTKEIDTYFLTIYVEYK